MSNDMAKEELLNVTISNNQLPPNNVNILHKYKQENNCSGVLAVTSDVYYEVPVRN